VLPQELMTTVFYPAGDVSGYPVAPQMSLAAAAVFKGFDAAYISPGVT
jgi:hypothetical protein